MESMDASFSGGNGLTNISTDYQLPKECTICREWNGVILTRETEFDIIQCRNCGLVYVDPKNISKEHEIERNQVAVELGSQYRSYVYKKNHTRWLNYFSKWAIYLKQISPGNRLLDIGCGVGYFVRTACDNRWDAYGLDTSFDDIQYGILNLNLESRLQTGTLQEIRYNFKFDAITLFSVIEHVDDPYQLLLEVSRILNPSGILLVKTPSQDSLITKLHWMLNRTTNGRVNLKLYNLEHIYRFSRETIMKLLTNSGYQCISVNYDDHLWITATRSLFNKKNKSIQYLLLSILFICGKLLRMQNQLTITARLASITAQGSEKSDQVA